ncbi:MAG: PDZ domain-containing protein [Anaerolineae bacterium]|nr:PDZ domain-containing protein [Anaerolineae bacterium]
MRKFGLFSLVALLVLALTAGAVFAQDDTTTQATEASAWLGISIRDTDGQVVVGRVQADSPAEAADIQAGDVIVSFNGEAVSTAAELSELVAAAAPGDSVTLEVERDGESVTIEATLGSAPDNLRGGPFGRGQMAQAIDPLTLAETLFNADLEEGDGGFTVVDTLTSRNPFNLEVGDLITAINGEDITTLDMQTLANAFMNSDDQSLSLTVTRDGEEVTLAGDLMGGFGMMGRGFGSDQGFGQRDGRGQRGGMPFGQGNGAPNDAAPATPETPAPDGQA